MVSIDAALHMNYRSINRKTGTRPVFLFMDAEL